MPGVPVFVQNSRLDLPAANTQARRGTPTRSTMQPAGWATTRPPIGALHLLGDRAVESYPDWDKVAADTGTENGQLVHGALSLAREAADTGGWLLLDLVFADQQHATAVLCSLGPDAEVVHPQALRDALAGRARQTLSRYDER